MSRTDVPARREYQCDVCDKREAVGPNDGPPCDWLVVMREDGPGRLDVIADVCPPCGRVRLHIEQPPKAAPATGRLRIGSS